ncbi:MAG: ABC transporter permease subunit, partial [Bacillota bacterium]|nr:ABC transporter permease subunit [Bacillota bacterium]
MNKHVVWAIAKKDMKSITSNSQVWIGFIITPILFCIILPAGMILAAKYLPVTDSNLIQMLHKILKSLPEGATRQKIESINKVNYQLSYIFINYLLGSLFLMIPCLNSMMIAVNSFVSEKEGRTLESLLFAPISVKELFVGKMLASFVPVMALTIGSFLCFVLITDVLTYSMFDSP